MVNLRIAVNLGGVWKEKNGSVKYTGLAITSTKLIVPDDIPLQQFILLVRELDPDLTVQQQIRIEYVLDCSGSKKRPALINNDRTYELFKGHAKNDSLHMKLYVTRAP